MFSDLTPLSAGPYHLPLPSKWKKKSVLWCDRAMDRFRQKHDLRSLKLKSDVLLTHQPRPPSSDLNLQGLRQDRQTFLWTKNSLIDKKWLHLQLKGHMIQNDPLMNLLYTLQVKTSLEISVWTASPFPLSVFFLSCTYIQLRLDGHTIHHFSQDYFTHR